MNEGDGDDPLARRQSDIEIPIALARLEAKLDMLIMSERDLTNELENLDSRLRSVERDVTGLTQFHANQAPKPGWTTIVAASVAVLSFGFILLERTINVVP